jgi:putative FmdB family regulatory protein
MPTYEYECTKCGHAWELFQSIKAEPERTCPKCRKRTAMRKIGIGAGILTGGRGGDAEPTAAAAPAQAAKPATDATGKADTGTKATSDAKPAPAPAPAAEGSVNATHPAREGRGAGNLRDAIARQRKQATARAKPARGRKGK